MRKGHGIYLNCCNHICANWTEVKDKMYKIVAIIFFIINTRTYGQEYKITDFRDYEMQVNMLEKAGNYDDAKILTGMVRDRFPEREFDLIKELVYLNFKTERYEENLILWAEGHKKGYFFLLNTRMKRYEPYSDNEVFPSLVEKDEQLRKASWEKSTTVYEIVLPDSLITDKEYPLIIILHGGGSNLKKTRARWKIFAELKSAYMVAFLQSYRHMDYNTFGWTSGDKKAHSGIKTCYDEIVNKYPVDTTRIILAGMSAGGTMAFDILFNNILPVNGVVAFCPGNPWISDSAIKLLNKPGVYMIGGASDYYLPVQKGLVALLQGLQIRISYEIIPGMGHEFPNDYESQMKKALSFLTGT
jgi:dienelactone hydrolase